MVLFSVLRKQWLPLFKASVIHGAARAGQHLMLHAGADDVVAVEGKCIAGEGVVFDKMPGPITSAFKISRFTGGRRDELPAAGIVIFEGRGGDRFKHLACLFILQPFPTFATIVRSQRFQDTHDVTSALDSGDE